MTSPTHRIVGVLEATKNKPLYARVQITYSGVTMVKTPRELNEPQWLSCFTPEDVSYIGFLNAVAYGNTQVPVSHFPRKKPQLTDSVIFLAILFVCFLMASNMTGGRICEIEITSTPWGKPLAVQFSAAIAIFPATYVLAAILTEVYGYRTSRMVIWGGLAATLFLVSGIFLLLQLPTSADWTRKTGISEAIYQTFFDNFIRTFFASTIACFVSEFANSAVLAKLKVTASGRYLGYRILFSTGLAVALDSIIFSVLAFGGIISNKQIVAISVIQFAFKLSYELALLPVTVYVSKYLKKRDGIDHYDFHTPLNPFAFSR